MELIFLYRKSKKLKNGSSHHEEPDHEKVEKWFKMVLNGL